MHRAAQVEKSVIFKNGVPKQTGVKIQVTFGGNTPVWFVAGETGIRCFCGCVKLATEPEPAPID